MSETKVMFTAVFCIAGLLFLGFMIGLIYGNSYIESSKEIKPEIITKCVDTKCDTTYLYKNPMFK